jgi:excisionase family DNA binding protein
VSAKYLTLVQAAELCATPAESIRYWVHIGKLAAFRPGRQVLIKEADLLELIESSAVSEIRVKKARAARKGRAA